MEIQSHIDQRSPTTRKWEIFFGESDQEAPVEKSCVEENISLADYTVVKKENMEILKEINEDRVIEKNHKEIDHVLKRISQLKITQKSN